MSFADHLYETAARRGCHLPPARHAEPLAALDYSTELALKREALPQFWQETGLPGRPEQLVPAPVPRGYRTTTKRRVSLRSRGLALTFAVHGPFVPGAARSVLDLPEHTAAYAWLLDFLSRPGLRPLTSALNWVIVRGPAGGLAVVLNARVFDARVMRCAKKLAEALPAAPLGVCAGFLYLDPSRSEYYLEARRPDTAVTFKKLFGPAWLWAEADGVRLRFPPTVFSQVNSAMLNVMTGSVSRLLSPEEGSALLDLYCGYGLFSLTVGRAAERVVGVDFDGPAIESARANAEHAGCGESVRFIAGRIDGAFLAHRLRPPASRELILLDPPKKGTAPSVIPALAERDPRRVVHICCGTEEIPREVAAWWDAGYRLRRALPLDLFAGTANLETLLLFSR